MEKMTILTFIFLFSFLHKRIDSKGLHYFSNFKFEKIVVGEEHLIQDYVALANDPKGNLPDSYTVCNSIFVKFATTPHGVVEMLKNDGSHWYLLELDPGNRIYERFSESMIISFIDPSTGKHEREYFYNSRIPIVPHSWYHICMGLDTESGLLRVVVNGVEVANEEKDFFKNTTSWKPRSVEAKITQFKAHISGLWMQTRHTFSNMHIFSSMLSMENMKKRTSDNGDCSSPGDYLR